MKRLLLLALCALFALNAEARTLYVDASRPNNKGNGRSVKKAKKTIQAAINVAKKGDTILVQPGTYSPIETNNKKIAIKSAKGQKKTKLVSSSRTSYGVFLADLSRPVERYNEKYDWTYTDHVGSATRLSGFLLDGRNEAECAVRCGTVKACTIQRFEVHQVGQEVVYHSKMSGCTLRNNYLFSGGSILVGCSVSETKIRSNKLPVENAARTGVFADGSTFSNCLIVGNEMANRALRKSTFLNCTIAKNTVKTRSDECLFSDSSKYYNCVLWNNHVQRILEEFDENGNYVEHAYPKVLHNVDPDNVYKNTDKTNRNPKLTSAYKPRRGSYCINSGKLTESQKKLVGKKDLAGRRRIRGKAIDRGCYEY